MDRKSLATREWAAGSWRISWLLAAFFLKGGVAVRTPGDGAVGWLPAPTPEC